MFQNCQTFEASDFWRGLLREVFGFEERVTEVEHVQLYCWRHPLLKRWISTPFRDRIALKWPHDQLPSLDLVALERNLSGQDIVLKDIGSLIGEKRSDIEGNLSTNYVNSSVPLGGELEQRFNRSARKNIRRAREVFGLKIDINPAGVLSDFYALYLRTRKRLGVVPYPFEFFEYLAAEPTAPVILFRCRQDGASVGYLWCYMHCEEMISAHIAYDFEQRNMRISDYLFASAFEWGALNSYTTYRFGADNANQQGLIKSKEKLGAVAIEQLDYSSKRQLNSIDKPGSLHRRVLRALPLAAFSRTSAITRWYCE